MSPGFHQVRIRLRQPDSESGPYPWLRRKGSNLQPWFQRPSSRPRDSGMVGLAGIEPAFFRLRGGCNSISASDPFRLVGRLGIEPRPCSLKGCRSAKELTSRTKLVLGRGTSPAEAAMVPRPQGPNVSLRGGAHALTSSAAAPFSRVDHATPPFPGRPGAVGPVPCLIVKGRTPISRGLDPEEGVEPSFRDFKGRRLTVRPLRKRVDISCLGSVPSGMTRSCGKPHREFGISLFLLGSFASRDRASSCHLLRTVSWTGLRDRSPWLSVDIHSHILRMDVSFVRLSSFPALEP
jgi:hypothetical protein